MKKQNDRAVWLTWGIFSATVCGLASLYLMRHHTLYTAPKLLFLTPIVLLFGAYFTFWMNLHEILDYVESDRLAQMATGAQIAGLGALFNTWNTKVAVVKWGAGLWALCDSLLEVVVVDLFTWTPMILGTGLALGLIATSEVRRYLVMMSYLLRHPMPR